ncbi:glycosyltransferase [Bradyrhizobium sp. CW11]|nr:glycosyltransferase [Bradyrhizobium sp. CW11]
MAIPAYNSAATLRETLNSVFWQPVARDEILVVKIAAPPPREPSR